MSSYIKNDNMLDSPCPQCGGDMEMLKNELMAKCTRCGYKFKSTFENTADKNMDHYSMGGYAEDDSWNGGCGTIGY